MKLIYNIIDINNIQYYNRTMRTATKTRRNPLLEKLGARLKNAAKNSPPKAIAESLKGALLEAFKENGLPEQTMLPGNAELAKFAGISHITLRKALCRLENDNIIRQTQGRGTQLLKSFSKEMTLKGTVSLILPYVGSKGQYGEFIDSVGKELTPLNIKLCVSSMEWARKGSFKEQMDSLLDIDDLAGVIRSPSIYPEEFIEEVNYFQFFDQSKAPAIFLDRQTKVNGISNVGFDDTSAMEKIFELAWERGFRDLYFIYSDISNLNLRNAERAKGFRLAADKRNYCWDKKFYSLHIGDNGEFAEKTARHILSESDKDIAFVCAGEGTGLSIQKALEKENLNGRRALITGFDRIEGVNTEGQDFPSTVRSRTEMGQSAAKLLIELIKKRNIGKREHETVLLAPQMVVEKGEYK